MTRVTCAVASRRRRKRIFKLTSGFWGDRKNHVRLSKDALMKALSYNYEHRKKKKGDFRKIWTIRINVGARINGMSYSKFIHGLKVAGCELNRKVLADLALKDPGAFREVVGAAKKALAA